MPKSTRGPIPAADAPSRRRPQPARRRRAAGLSLASLLAGAGVVFGACGATAQAGRATRPPASTGSRAAAASTVAAGVSEAPCGPAGPATAAHTVALAAERIYRLELVSAEVHADQRQVEQDAPLLSAVAGGNRAAIAQAVTRLVYSHTHIVRLRVTRGAAVLSDVGGPYIIAPVRGSLRLNGRTVGSYVLSVQDDLGYVKLESRYVGVPMLLRRGSGGVPVEGVIASSSAIPDSGPVSYRGGSYQAVSFGAEAFPSGALKVTLLVPTPPPAMSCAAIRAYELGRIAQTTWHRFVSVGAPPSAYVKTAHDLTGGLVYVRVGSRQLAGATSPGPGHLPPAGTVSYRGVSYRVSSFPAATPSGQGRVYALIAP